MFNTINIIIFLIISLLALIPLLFLVDRYNFIHLHQNRISTIDGLRGYLAIGVFTHHFVVTHNWYLTGNWHSPSENFLNNIGQASVAIFFMITGYLFSRKIKYNDFEVRRFFIKRFFRLMPILYFSIVIIVFIVFYKQNFKLHDTIFHNFAHILEWMVFLRPDINGLKDTAIINAGVTWTLMYEALFYLSLPIIFYAKKIRVILIALLILILYAGMKNLYINLVYTKVHGIFFILFFIGYIVSEIEIRYKHRYNFDNNLISIINAVLILFALFYFKSAYNLLSFLILGTVFAFIVLGNSLFGLLKHNYSKILGEISYSIYLLHAIVLFVVFNLIYKKAPSLYHMPIVLFLAIFISILTFKYIENPLNEFGHKLSKRVKAVK